MTTSTPTRRSSIIAFAIAAAALLTTPLVASASGPVGSPNQVFACVDAQTGSTVRRIVADGTERCGVDEHLVIYAPNGVSSPATPSGVTTTTNTSTTTTATTTTATPTTTTTPITTTTRRSVWGVPPFGVWADVELPILNYYGLGSSPTGGPNRGKTVRTFKRSLDDYLPLQIGLCGVNWKSSGRSGFQIDWDAKNQQFPNAYFQYVKVTGAVEEFSIFSDSPSSGGTGISIPSYLGGSPPTSSTAIASTVQLLGNAYGFDTLTLRIDCQSATRSLSIDLTRPSDSSSLDLDNAIGRRGPNDLVTVCAAGIEFSGGGLTLQNQRGTRRDTLNLLFTSFTANSSKSSYHSASGLWKNTNPGFTGCAQPTTTTSTTSPRTPANGTGSSPFLAINGTTARFPVVGLSDFASTPEKGTSGTVVRPFDAYGPYQLGSCLAMGQTKGVDRVVDYNGIANRVPLSSINAFLVNGNREITTLTSPGALSTATGTSSEAGEDTGASSVLESTLRGLGIADYRFDGFSLTAQCDSRVNGAGITLQLSRRRDPSSVGLATAVTRYQTQRTPIKVCAAGIEFSIRSSGIVPNPELSDGARETFTVDTRDFTATSSQSTMTSNGSKGRTTTFALARSATPPCTQAPPPAGYVVNAGPLALAGPGSITLAPGQPGIPLIYFDPSANGGFLVQRRVDASTTETLRRCLAGDGSDKVVDLAGIRTGMRRSTIKSMSINGDLETLFLVTTDPITVGVGQTDVGNLVVPTPKGIAGSAQITPSLSAAAAPVPFDGITLEAQCVGPSGGAKAALDLSVTRQNDTITPLLDSRTTAPNTTRTTVVMTVGPLTIATSDTFIGARPSPDATHKSYGLNPSVYTFSAASKTLQFDTRTQRVV